MFSLRHLPLLLAAFALPVTLCGQFTDGLNVEFGKNRVQHRTFEWQYFEQGMFEVYHYKEGERVAGQVARILSDEAKSLEPLFGKPLDGPIQVLVFKSQEEFRQSNVGVMAADDQESNIGGTAKLIGSKMFLYATGDRVRLEQDVREGLARICFNQAMYDNQWSEALRSGSLIQVPEWMSNGLARYASRGMDASSLAFMLDACQRNDLAKLDQSYGEEAALLGQGIWSYIVDVYGLPTVSNILYMTRISRSLEDGFRLGTGMYMDQLVQEVRGHFLSLTRPGFDDVHPILGTRKEWRKASRKFNEDLDWKLKRRYDYTQITPSPDGQVIAFATNERGQRRIGTFHVPTGEVQWHQVIGHRLDRLRNDLAPRLAWRNDGGMLAFSFDDRGAPRLGLVDMESEEVVIRELFKVDQILSMTFSPSGRDLVFSALEDGQSDLYLYSVVGNYQTPLWKDRFDDLDPMFWPDGDRLIFASNRPDATLRKDNSDIPYPAETDLFVCDLTQSPPVLEQWTETPTVHERQPYPIGSKEFQFLQHSGTSKQSIGLGWRDSVVVAVDTIVRYREYTELREAVVLDVPVTGVFLQPGNEHGMARYAGQIHWWSLPIPDPSTLHNTAQLESEPQGASNNAYPSVLPSWNRSFGELQIDYKNYVFEQEKSETPSASTDSDSLEVDEESLEPTYARLLPKNYRLNFALDKLQTQVNNTFGTSFYQPYNGNVNAQPGLGNASEIRLSDLMDDKHVVGGYTIPANLSNTAFGLAFVDLSKRLDKAIIFQRQSNSRLDPNTGSQLDVHTHLIQREWTWPLDEVRSLRWSVIGRIDRNILQGTNLYALLESNRIEEQVGVQVAWVHDDSRSVRPNIRVGMRARVWTEMFVDGLASAQLAGSESAGESTNNWSFGTIGFDARKYIPIIGPSILALRLAGDWSIGQKRLLHMLGGTDNSLSISGNENTPVDPDLDFAYQTRITPLRGFKNNVRNGSNVAVANAEVRVPVFFNSAGKSDFLNNLQGIGFMDVGTAWSGLHPYADDNHFNYVVEESNPITVTIASNREPIVYDFGFGLRSRVLGYWVAADWAYGVDAGIRLPRRFTLSLNFDF